MLTDDRRASSCARAARAIDRSRVPLEVSLSVVVVFVVFVVVFVVFVVVFVVFVVFVDDEERARRDATRRDATRRDATTDARVRRRWWVSLVASLSSRLSRRVARLRPRVIIIIIIGAEIATTSRMDLEGRATGDDVARRLERDARETRERREVSISESRDRGRTRTDDDDGRRRFDSIRDLI